MAKADAHTWKFKARFRRHAFGWKSQPAIARVKAAVSEIKQVARTDAILAAGGAVLFLEKVSAALEHVDSSSGAIGTAVNNALADKRWAVHALAAQGKASEAIRYAESCRSPWASSQDVDRLCEAMLLASDRAEEAYARYALGANRAGTHLAWFRAVARKYPLKPPADILADLVRHTPGDEGKWFAAAKDAGLFDEAIALANRTPCDPKTLTRAARDFGGTNPAFAMEAGMAALHWLVEGYGYEITSADVWAAYSHTLEAARHAGGEDATRARIRALVASEQQPDRFMTKVLGRGSIMVAHADTDTEEHPGRPARAAEGERGAQSPQPEQRDSVPP